MLQEMRARVENVLCDVGLSYVHASQKHGSYPFFLQGLWGPIPGCCTVTGRLLYVRGDVHHQVVNRDLNLAEAVNVDGG